MLRNCALELFIRETSKIEIMGEREDNVYKAKLAEQAERYDGKKLELDLLDDRRSKL